MGPWSYRRWSIVGIDLVEVVAFLSSLSLKETIVLCHVCEEEMLNRHETDLTTLIQGLHFNNKNKIEIIHSSNRFI